MVSNTANTLVVMALENESHGLFEDHNIPVLYTGVGKINAAYHLTKALANHRLSENKIELVLNLGTAGSRKFSRGSLVLCTKFFQHDINLSALGFKRGETPYETTIPMILEHNHMLKRDIFIGTCGTGDSFAAPDIKVECDVADMEAYALAKVCWLEKVPFMSIKYITNGPDGKAGSDWESALEDGAKKLFEMYEFISRMDKEEKSVKSEGHIPKKM